MCLVFTKPGAHHFVFIFERQKGGETCGLGLFLCTPGKMGGCIIPKCWTLTKIIRAGSRWIFCLLQRRTMGNGWTRGSWVSVLAEVNGHQEVTQLASHHLVIGPTTAAFFPFMKAVFVHTLGRKNQVRTLFILWREGGKPGVGEKKQQSWIN